jgi:hypothetical protein
MRPSSALSILVLAFTLSCKTTTDPDDPQSEGHIPSLSSSVNQTECVGALPPGTYKNIVVPANETCTITSSTVKGDITALDNSRLTVREGTTVSGSIQADNSFDVETYHSNPEAEVIVRGSITLRNVTGGISICGTTLTHGDIVVEGSTGSHILLGGQPCNEGFGGSNILKKGSIVVQDNNVAQSAFGAVNFQIGDNQVARNLQVYRNLGLASKFVGGNTVGGALQCFDNDLPFVGGPNTAQNAEGQCF